jgi:hypothetical protein
MSSKKTAEAVEPFSTQQATLSFLASEWILKLYLIEQYSLLHKYPSHFK